MWFIPCGTLDKSKTFIIVSFPDVAIQLQHLENSVSVEVLSGCQAIDNTAFLFGKRVTWLKSGSIHTSTELKQITYDRNNNKHRKVGKVWFIESICKFIVIIC